MEARRTILVVDDDAQMRAFYASALRLHGYNVALASDGLGALRVIQDRSPSLVILDLNMPCVDGWTVLRELAAHESTRAIPVIVVTGEEDADRAVASAAAILKKPISVEQVLPLVQSYLPAA